MKKKASTTSNPIRRSRPQRFHLARKIVRGSCQRFAPFTRAFGSRSRGGPTAATRSLAKAAILQPSSSFLSESSAETRRFGASLGKVLSAGDVVTLSGGLGAGKTTLIKGLAKGLDSKDAVSSPTFTVIHEYEGRLKIYHLDWYRLKKVAGPDRQMVLECMNDPGAVTLIEWPERGRNLLPARAVRLQISHAGGDGRKISWKGISI